MLSIDITDQSDLVKSLSVLFVDDDADVRDGMSHFLSRRVAIVNTAKNGVEGRDLVKNQNPDLVISDIRMDGMDGLAMCREIRETMPDLPMIFISAHNESDILLSSIDLGITKFIVKPVDTNVLMDTINSVARSLERTRNSQIQLRQMELSLNEADYESESIKRYVTSYLESSHHDEISGIRHLSIAKSAVNGDFYSVAKHGDDTYILLADGAGHGLSAVMPALQIPRVFQQQATHGFSLIAIASEINRSLHEQHFAEHFVAATLVRINAADGFIEVLNCSNPPVFIFAEDGSLLHTCHSKSTALGVAGEDEFLAEIARFPMKQSARIYLFTDGLPDMLRASMPTFDMNYLQALFEGDHPFNIFDGVAKKIENTMHNFKVDDITLLEVYFDSKAAQIASSLAQL